MAGSWHSIDWALTWSAITSVLTLGLLIVTGVYAWLTFKMVRAAEGQIREAGRPRILVYVAPREPTFLTLCVENIGLSTAQNVELTIDRPLHPTYGRIEANLQDVPMFSKIVRSIPPQVVSRFGLGTAYLNENLDRLKHPLEFCVSAHYQFSNYNYCETFNIDIHAQFSRVLLNPQLDKRPRKSGL